MLTCVAAKVITRTIHPPPYMPTYAPLSASWSSPCGESVVVTSIITDPLRDTDLKDNMLSVTTHLEVMS